MDRQERRVRDFVPDKSLETQKYFVYFKFSNCIYGTKDPLSAADDSIIVSNKQKSPCSPKGTRTENTFLRYHLVCRKIRPPLQRCQHTVCPLTLALRQKILWVTPFPPALGGPFTAPLFAPLSAPGTLCGCALQFYFRLNGFCD